MSIFDQLVVVPEPLEPLPALALQLDTKCSLGDKINSRPLEVGPWMVCQTTPTQAGSRWNDLCARLSERGLLVECSVAALEKLPVTSIPRRLFRQTVGVGLALEELQSADVVEFTCQRIQYGAWGWPPEVDSTEGMQDWIEAVKQVTGKTPVGLGVHAGVNPTTLNSMLDWPIDFITLHTDGSSELLLNSMSHLRTKLRERGLQRPILVRGPISRADHLVKILMLGASAVTIDSCLLEIWKSNPTSIASSFLGARMQPNAPLIKCPIGELLDALNVNLNTCLQTGSRDGHSIRALTSTAAQLAGVKLLGEAT